MLLLACTKIKVMVELVRANPQTLVWQQQTEQIWLLMIGYDISAFHPSSKEHFGQNKKSIFFFWLRNPNQSTWSQFDY